MIQPTMPEMILIVRKAIDIGNEIAREQGNAAEVRSYDALDAATQAMAIVGIARAIEAMQLVGFKVERVFGAAGETSARTGADVGAGARAR